jgi:hypothetical protein
MRKAITKNNAGLDCVLSDTGKSTRLSYRGLRMAANKVTAVHGGPWHSSRCRGKL